MIDLRGKIRACEVQKGRRATGKCLYNLIVDRINFAVEKSRAGSRTRDDEPMGHKYNTAHLFVYQVAAHYKAALGDHYYNVLNQHNYIRKRRADYIANPNRRIKKPRTG